MDKVNNKFHSYFFACFAAMYLHRSLTYTFTILPTSFSKGYAQRLYVKDLNAFSYVLKAKPHRSPFLWQALIIL